MHLMYRGNYRCQREILQCLDKDPTRAMQCETLRSLLTALIICTQLGGEKSSPAASAVFLVETEIIITQLPP